MRDAFQYLSLTRSFAGMAPFTRAAHRGSRQISYREDDTTSSSEDGDPETDEVVSGRLPSSPSLNKQSRTLRSSPQETELISPTRKRKAPSLNRSKKSLNRANSQIKQKDDENDQSVLQLGGNILPWQNLPYQILASIFQYLIHLPWAFSWRGWLVKTALLCKSFVEPALSALYHTLDFTTITRIAQLYDLLEFQTTDSYLNYRGKVKWLVFPTTPGKLRYPRQLDQIVAFTPQLQGIQIVTYCARIDRNWHIPSLEDSHIVLRSWVWVNYGTSYVGRVGLNRVYPAASFQTLERVEINQWTNEIKWHTQDFAAAINILPCLKHLAFNLVNVSDPELLLSLLSVNLESLEIWACQSVSPDKLALFLAVQGQKLQLLRLSGIYPQSHSVTVNLARSCPQLKDLRIDFASSWNISSPAGPKGPRCDEIPTWPPSLWRLELLQWGGWTLSAADVFFSSLVDSAAALPNLRHIHIRASLGESGWKSRVRFRDKWTRRFSRVFLRTSEPPSPYLKSLSAYQAFKTAQETLARTSVAYNSLSHPATSGRSSKISRKSEDLLCHVGSEQSRSEINTTPVFVESSQLRGRRRSHRLKQHAGNSQHTEDSQRPLANSSPLMRHRRRRRRRVRGSDSDSSSEDSALADTVGEKSDDDTSKTCEDNYHIQGLCDIVDIQFDNLRPSDQQLRESDFLDEEISGDEDWNGSESAQD